MRTIEKAHRILAHAPREAMNDALGLAAVAALIFAGFLAPTLM